MRQQASKHASPARVTPASQLLACVHAAEATPSVSEQCREEVFQFKIQRSSNINANVPLGELPGIDAEQKGRSPQPHHQ